MHTRLQISTVAIAIHRLSLSLERALCKTDPYMKGPHSSIFGFLFSGNRKITVCPWPHVCSLATWVSNSHSSKISRKFPISVSGQWLHHRSILSQLFEQMPFMIRHNCPYYENNSFVYLQKDHGTQTTSPQACFCLFYFKNNYRDMLGPLGTMM